jgi:cell wall-associated NlpC family hydrolase
MSEAVPEISLADVPAILKPGDVLLMRGDSAVSDLIMTLSGGDYSHAGFWSAAGDIIDAGPAGVLHVPLETRLYEEDVIDVFRFHSDAGEEMGSDGYPEANVDASFEGWVNKPDQPTKFAYHTLFLVAVLFIVKAGTEHVPGKRIVRLMFEWALEVINDWLKDGQKAVICSGLVYRAFREARYHDLPHRYQIYVDNPYVLPPDAPDNAPLPSLAGQLAALGDSADAARRFLQAYGTSLGFDDAASDLDAIAHHVYADFVSPADLQWSDNLTRIGRVKRDY